jgi:hypothetical protein
VAPFMLPLCQFHFVAVVEGDEKFRVVAFSGMNVDSEWANIVSLSSMVGIRLALEFLCRIRYVFDVSTMLWRSTYMSIPKWEQTPCGYGESPNANFFVSLPLSIRGLPIWLRGLCFWHPFSHALKNIFFAEASQFSCAHRANIPYHHHTSIAIAVASR